jgi:hypothetical protein
MIDGPDAHKRGHQAERKWGKTNIGVSGRNRARPRRVEVDSRIELLAFRGIVN